jgi:hypothetical protein
MPAPLLATRAHQEAAQRLPAAAGIRQILQDSFEFELRISVIHCVSRWAAFMPTRTFDFCKRANLKDKTAETKALQALLVMDIFRMPFSKRSPKNCPALSIRLNKLHEYLKNHQKGVA